MRVVESLELFLQKKFLPIISSSFLICVEVCRNKVVGRMQPTGRWHWLDNLILNHDYAMYIVPENYFSIASILDR